MKVKKWMIVVAVLLIFLVIGRFSRNKAGKESPTTESVKVEQNDWSVMTYEERNAFLNDLIKNNTLKDVDSDLKSKLRVLIGNECNNPSSVSFTLQPSIYNGFANVVEADSGWIYTPFKCTAKNDFGVEKELSGSVMFVYLPKKRTLDVKHWDMGQNN